ncbi:MAG: Cthe_2314 family HEPN domain-containing protein [Ignavibacteriaceae bacterium]|nr:Cthe_2314 family HEPN domain-containing protein [Ignavibacteriaceae bacterium]
MEDIRIINERYQLFLTLDKHIFDVYNEENLKCIDEAYENGDPLTSIFTKIIDKKNKLHKFNSVEYQLDISFISKDIKYLTGLLYYLHPYINIPSKEDNTYFQTTCDKRYLVFASLANQCLYNFWDRVGDLLYVFFETGLKEDSVYLSRVLNNFPEIYKVSKNYILLKDIYDNKLKELFNQRQQIVHYKQLGTKHYLGLQYNYSDKEKAVLLEKEKTSYPKYFKEQSELTFKGFYIALNLINELPDKI